MSHIRKIKDMRPSGSSCASPIVANKANMAKSAIAAAVARSSQRKAAKANDEESSPAERKMQPLTGKIIGNVTPQRKNNILDKDEELIASSPSERNWRGIFIALLVIAGVLGLIMFSIFLLSPEEEGQRVKGHRLTLSDVLGNTLKWKPFNGSWTSDGDLLYRDSAGGLSILSPETGVTRNLMTDSAFRQLNADQYDVSPDLKYVLLASDATVNPTSNRIESRYSVFEVANRHIFALSHRDGLPKPPLMQLVRWSPPPRPTTGPTQSAPSQGIAFVHDNDVYYKPKVQNDLVCRLTESGMPGLVYNGIRDWLYENTDELRSGETLAFSPDGGYLAFVSYNDTQVDRFEYTWLGDSWKYPQIRSIRYPKDGSRNPNVTVYVVDLSALKLIQRIRIVPPAPFDAHSEAYVGRMQWASAHHLSVTFMDRKQNASLTALCSAPAFGCRAVHVDQIIDNGLVLATDRTIFGKLNASHFDALAGNQQPMSDVVAPGANESVITFDAKEFDSTENAGAPLFMLKRLPVRDGEYGHYRHVVFVSASHSDRRTVALTMGQFEVTALLGWDEPNELVYFMAAPYQRPGERHLYRVRVNLNVTRTPNRIFVTSSRPMCLTCDNGPHTFGLLADVDMTNASSLSGSNRTSADRSGPDPIPNNCLYNEVLMSPDFGHYVQECLGPEVPSVYLVRTDTRQKIRVLHSGSALRGRLAKVAMPQLQTFQVEVQHGFRAQVRLMLPPGMRVDEDVAFPLILQMNTAPGSQLVTQRFSVDWNWYMCSQRSMIIAQIDGRGSGGQGERMRSQLKGHLGTVEIEDQLGVLTYLRDKFRFVDPTKICAYGWGYGGYATAMVLTEDSQRVLLCGISINPIVSFAHHSNFFTDRYMPSNIGRLRSMQESDLSMRAGNLNGSKFMLVHGTADTLVQQQHSLMLARSLIDQGVGFRHQVYTDEGHSLEGVLTHLYKTMEWFIDECFGPLIADDWDPAGFFAFRE